MTDPRLLSRRAKTPTQERGERRVADLLGAAEQIFASVGYEAATMSGIAQLAGSAIGSLYQFFPNKESIGSALLACYMNELGRQLDAWKDDLPDSFAAFGRDLIALIFDYCTQRPVFRILAETPAVPRADGMEYLGQCIRSLLATFVPAMKSSELSTVALAAALIVRAAVQGSRMVDPKKGAAMRREIQDALGIYLEARLGPARLGKNVL